MNNEKLLTKRRWQTFDEVALCYCWVLIVKNHRQYDHNHERIYYVILHRAVIKFLVSTVNFDCASWRILRPFYTIIYLSIFLEPNLYVCVYVLSL